MFGRVFIVCFLASMLTTVASATAHEHCDSIHKHGSHAVKRTAAAEIPNVVSDIGRHLRATQEAPCLFSSLVHVNHCHAGDCYLKCGDSSQPTSSTSNGGGETAVLSRYSFAGNLAGFPHLDYRSDQLALISIPPEPRPPSA